MQVLSRVTNEGYTPRAIDPSYWNDPSLPGEEWRMSRIPAIVSQCKQFKAGGHHSIKVILLMRSPPPTDVTRDAVPLQIKDTSMLSSLPDNYGYSFQRVYAFACDSDQVRIL